MHGTKEIDFASNSCPVSRFLYTGTCDEFEGDTFPGRQLCCQLNLPVAPLPDSLFQPVISFNHGSVSVFDDSSISTDPCPRIQRQTIWSCRRIAGRDGCICDYNWAAWNWWCAYSGAGCFSSSKHAYVCVFNQRVDCDLESIYIFVGSTVSSLTSLSLPCPLAVKNRTVLFFYFGLLLLWQQNKKLAQLKSNDHF